MLTDRFLAFLRAEWNHLLSLYEKDSTSSKTQKNIFETIFGSYQKQNKNNNTSREEAYQTYQQYYQQQKEQMNQEKIREAKYYDALEIKPGATFEQIKVAYKTAMKKYHPDRFVGDPEKQKYAQILSQKINEAFQYFEKKMKV